MDGMLAIIFIILAIIFYYVGIACKWGYFLITLTALNGLLFILEKIVSNQYNFIAFAD